MDFLKNRKNRPNFKKNHLKISVSQIPRQNTRQNLGLTPKFSKIWKFWFYDPKMSRSKWKWFFIDKFSKISFQLSKFEKIVKIDLVFKNFKKKKSWNFQSPRKAKWKFCLYRPHKKNRFDKNGFIYIRGGTRGRDAYGKPPVAYTNFGSKIRTSHRPGSVGSPWFPNWSLDRIPTNLWMRWMENEKFLAMNVFNEL